MRVKLDRVDDYLELRRKLYGVELAPLPTSLKLNTTDFAGINPSIASSRTVDPSLSAS